MHETDTPEGSDRGLYVYCFVPCGAELPLALAGTHEGESLALLRAGDVAAVYAQVRIAEFRTGPSADSSEEAARIVARACQHERVVEEVMKSTPVLPVRFGAVFSSAQALAQVLAENSQTISQFLFKVSDKQEWAVKGFVDVSKAAQWALSSDPALAEESRLMSDCAGTQYLQERRLQGKARRRAAALSRSAALEARLALESLAVDWRPSKLAHPTDAAQDTEMVLNCAFLVPTRDVAAFMERVETLSEQHRDKGIAFRLSGPWPPYSFCPTIGGTRQ